MNWRRGTLALTGGLALLALAACGIGGSTTETHTYQVTDATSKLVIDDNSGQVQITVGDGPVRVHETVRYGKQRPHTTHRSADGTVRLASGSCWSVFDWGCQVDYEVRVPAGTSVEVHADAGKVSVTGLTGDLDVTAQAGEVTASDLGSAHVRVRAQAGSVTLRYRAVPSTVEARADAGDIGIWVPATVSYSVDSTTDAGSGRVEVPTDGASPHHITVHADAGSVRIHPA